MEAAIEMLRSLAECPNLRVLCECGQHDMVEFVKYLLTVYLAGINHSHYNAM